MQIGSGEFHIFAYQVTADDQSVLSAVCPEMAEDLERVYDLNGDSLNTIEINNLDYVLVIYPFSK